MYVYMYITWCLIGYINFYGKFYYNINLINLLYKFWDRKSNNKEIIIVQPSGILIDWPMPDEFNIVWTIADHTFVLYIYIYVLCIPIIYHTFILYVWNYTSVYSILNLDVHNTHIEYIISEYIFIWMENQKWTRGANNLS